MGCCSNKYLKMSKWLWNVAVVLEYYINIVLSRAWNNYDEYVRKTLDVKASLVRTQKIVRNMIEKKIDVLLENT